MDQDQPTEPLPPSSSATPSGEPSAAGAAPRDEPVAPAGPVPPEPFYKRHGLAFAISTLVLGVIVLFGVIGAGAVVAVTVGHSVASLTRELPRDLREPDGRHDLGPGEGRPGDGTQQGGGGSQQGDGSQQGGGMQRELVRGTLDSRSGSTWHVTTASGSTVTVTVTSSTAFGTPAKPAAASDFAVGDEVIVVGTDRSGDSITATRIVKLGDIPRPPSTPGPAPGSGGL